jgi:hypothetical protein
MCARNDNGLANEMRASKAMFGWLSTKGKTGLLEFLVFGLMCGVPGLQKRVKEVKVMCLSHIVLNS